jgi:mannose-1-phosphate guanylyltransferase
VIQSSARSVAQATDGLRLPLVDDADPHKQEGGLLARNGAARQRKGPPDAGAAVPPAPVRHEGPWALVLAGGEGKRLQALTREIAGAPIPKQYCRITGDRSLLEATLARIEPLVPPERTLVVINRSHLGLALPQLRRLPHRNVLVQPENRETGPGILFGLLHLVARRPRTPVAVFPSDHYIDDDAAFRLHVERAARLIDHVPTKIALLGIRATHAEPGYGYIEPGHPIVVPGDDAPTAYRVKAFREKPAADVAAQLLRNGSMWNSFVMVFRPGHALALLRRKRPADVERMRTVTRLRVPRAGYERLSCWNFSAGFLSQVPRQLAVVPVDGVGWSDWGTPEAVERTLAARKIETRWRRPSFDNQTGPPTRYAVACGSGR